MKILLPLLVLFTLASCSLFTNKNKILTENEWILSNTDYYENSKGNMYFKRSEEKLKLKFYDNGVVEIFYANSIGSFKSLWNWESSNKERIVIDKWIDNSSSVTVIKIMKGELTLSVRKEIFGSASYMYFLTPDSKEWPGDEFVDGYRAAKSNDQSKSNYEKELNVKVLISLIDSIKNDDYVLDYLQHLNFRKKSTDFYVSNEKIGQKEKEWINVTKQGSNIISFHTADKEIWQKIREELNLIGKPTKFNEGSSQVERFIGEKFTLESLKPEKGIDLKNNEVFEIYVYRNKKE